VVTKVDGEPVSQSPHRQALLDAGFLAGYRGLVLRPSGGLAPRSGLTGVAGAARR
jgi:hypothetical protein